MTDVLHVAPLADDGGGDGTQWTSWLTPGVVLTLAVVVLVVLLVAGVIIWRVVRRLRRSGTFERGLLTARAHGLPPGPAREIAALRLRVRAELETTTAVLGQAAATDVASVQLTPVLAGLQRTAAAVDADLRNLEADPDPARQRERLMPYQKQVEELLAATARIRDAATRTAADNRETDLRAITARVNDQVSYLDLYQQNYRRQYQPSELDLGGDIAAPTPDPPMPPGSTTPERN